jgi:hypothetical protein
MSIKYAELNIIRNLEEETIFSYVKRMCGNENKFEHNDTLIISFDNDGSTICDVKNEYDDKYYKFGKMVYHYSTFPNYFITKKKNNLEILFIFKPPNILNGQRTLNFKKIFQKNQKFLTSGQYSSVYNVIYTCNNDEVFSIVKNSLNNIKPIYLIAYDDKYFERGDIVYLVSQIFRSGFEIKNI